ncbi:unnamed protein product [Somion occarium]|uniref:Uncharacterized protein n=1 Tax=Somion occarium TaxID=3059160 RepID=A0ABP1CIS6_9APHY
MTLRYHGGAAPYQLMLTPVFGTPRVMNIPDSSFSNGKGSYQTPLDFPKGQKFLATMSDASGLGTGGTTDLLEVGASVGNAGCNTADPGVDFFFELNTALQQCRPFTFGNYVGAVQPVTITGVIPGGQAFVLNPPVGPTSYDWNADVAAGTGIIFILTDSKGRKGGSSDVRVVGVSDDNSCLSTNSPTSASIVPSASTSQAASTSGGSAAPTSTNGSGSDNSSTSSKKPSGAVIAGAAAAGLFALATIAVLVMFCLRRRRKNRYGHQRFGSLDLTNDPPPGPMDHANLPVVNPYPMTPSYTGSHMGTPSSHNLLSPDGTHYAQSDVYPLTNPYGPSTYSPSAYGASAYGASAYGGVAPSHARSPSNAESAAAASSSRGGRETLMSWGGNTVSSAARQKAAAAGIPLNHAPVPARFILHTDLEESVPPPPAEEEVIELPPQYSERRAPIPGLGPTDSFGTPPSPASPPPPTIPTIPGPSSSRS